MFALNQASLEHQIITSGFHEPVPQWAGLLLQLPVYEKGCLEKGHFSDQINTSFRGRCCGARRTFRVRPRRNAQASTKPGLRVEPLTLRAPCHFPSTPYAKTKLVSNEMGDGLVPGVPAIGSTCDIMIICTDPPKIPSQQTTK